MIISLDTEYSEKNIRKAELLSISTGHPSSTQQYHPDTLQQSDGRLKLITDKAKVIFVQNGVVDWYMLHKNGLTLDKSKFVDIMLLEHLIDERLEHSLGDMAKRHFNDPYKEIFWSKYSRFQDAPEDEAAEYEAKDVRYTFDIGVKYTEILKDRWPLVEHVHRLQWALFETEIRGLRVNRDLIVKTKQTMGPQIEALKINLGEQFKAECSVWELSKWTKEIEKLNSDNGKLSKRRPKFGFSDPQLQWLIYDMLEYPVLQKTKKKNPSTKVKALEELNELQSGLDEIIEYKSLKSAYPTFVVGLLERVVGNRVYPTFYVNGTDTGRISSSDPNMQNMPRKGVFRNFFIPDEGNLIIGADFTGLEVGVEANLTNDPALLKIMLEDANKHDITAQAVGMPRQDAKTLNFLCQYGGGVWKIKQTFGVSEKTAQEIYDRYWQAYAGVRDYKERVFKELADTGRVRNCFGRDRHFDPPNNSYEEGKQQRQAYSHMVQGPGAEMNNAATYLVSEYFNETGMGSLMMPVHDELVCQVRKDKTEEAIAAIVSLMENTNTIAGFKYPIKAASYGPLEYWQKI